jgi:hypothetical protein
LLGRVISTFIILMRTNASAAALLKSPTALIYLDSISPPTIAMSGTFGHALDWTSIFPRERLALLLYLSLPTSPASHPFPTATRFTGLLLPATSFSP